MFTEIITLLTRLYLEDGRPWLIGFSGGKDSTMLASLIFEAVFAIEPDKRIKPITVVCTDTGVEIPAIEELIEIQLGRMQSCSLQNNLNISVELLRRPAAQSFWVNIIGRGYPPPNRIFRWCTQRLKIDPVSEFIKEKLGTWGEAIIHLGARSAESNSRAQTLASREKKAYGLRKHPDLPRVWVSTPIEDLSTEEVWAYLLQKQNPWGSSNKQLYKLYSDASGGECPMVVDKSTPSCGNSRFGCWTCTVVERDKASEGLLESGDDRMEKLIAFRETLLHFRNPDNGLRDPFRKNGNEAPGPLTIPARKELLAKLLELQDSTGLKLITQEELLLIQTCWNSAREPDKGNGVAEIVHAQKGYDMLSDDQRLSMAKLEDSAAKKKELSPETFRRLLAKVSEYTESHRPVGLPDELIQILQDALREETSNGAPNA